MTMLDTSSTPTSEWGDEDIASPICLIGMTMDDQLVMLWSEERIRQVRQQMSPEDLSRFMEMLEDAFSKFIGAICGGRQ